MIFESSGKTVSREKPLKTPFNFKAFFVLQVRQM